MLDLIDVLYLAGTAGLTNEEHNRVIAILKASGKEYLLHTAAHEPKEQLLQALENELNIKRD